MFDYQRVPQYMSQYIRRPRPSPRPGRRLGPLQVWNLPQQAPQGQGHSNGFLWAFKAAVMGFQSCRLPARKRSKPSKTFQTLQTLQDLPNPPNTVPSRHPRAKATSRTGTPGPRPQQWLSMGFQSCRLPARKPSKTLQNPPNTVPSRHPRAKATSRTGTPGPRPQQWLSMGFQSCRLPARKRSKPSKTFQTLQTLQNLPNPPNTVPSRRPRAKATAMAFYRLSKLPFASPQTLQNPPKPSKTLQNPPKPSKPSKHRPQQAPQGQGHSNGFLWAFKAAVCQPTNAPNLPKPSKPSKPPKTFQTLQAPSPAGAPVPRPQQWLSIGFQSCRLVARKPSKTLQNPPNPPNPPNTVPSRHPRAKATSRTGTPGPRPQQWLSIGFQSCRLPARKPSKTLQTLQTPSLAGTPGPRPLPEQAPQGQGHSNGFLWAFKAAVMGFQSCRLPARKRSKPSKTFQTLQTLQNLPNPPNTVPSRHPRAKATSRTGTPGPRPQQWLSMGFQSCRCQPANPPKPSKTLQTLQTPSPAGTPGPRPLPQQWLFIGFQGCRLPARKPSKTLQNPPEPSKPSKHRPQQAPQGQGHFPNRHPRAKPTAMAFYGLSKLPFASPQTLQTLQNPPKPPNPPKPSKPSKHLPKPSKPSKTFQNPPNTFPNRHPSAKATSQTGTPGPRPQQWLSMGFQSCRLPARKPSKTFQNPPNTVPSRHPRAKATSRTGTPGPRPLRSPQLAFGPSD